MLKKIHLLFAILLFQSFAISQESLKIVWLEKYEWKILSNQENENLHVIELIPGAESAETWTLLGQMMSIKGVTNLPMEEAKNLMFDQTKKNAPKAKLTVIKQDSKDEFPWILFKIEKVVVKGAEHPESQLWYIRQGKTALYVNFIAKKKKKLKDDFVAEWEKVFLASEIVQLDGTE